MHNAKAAHPYTILQNYSMDFADIWYWGCKLKAIKQFVLIHAAQIYSLLYMKLKLN
jgi:hypothetical protein